jgi:hypothetical protein
MKSNQRPDGAQRNAQQYFKKAELQPEALAKQIRKKERAASAANTAKLRELRLAKEAEEKEARDKSAVDKPGSGVTTPRKRARSGRSVVRMTY